MKRLLLIVLIICAFCLLLQGTVATGNKVFAKNCICCTRVECYYPGYKPGIDLPFASKVVYSCAEAKEYRRYVTEKEDRLIFFSMYPAKD